WKLSKTPVNIRIPANCLGEHNHYVLHELLGLSQAEITKLEEEQIIGTIYLETAEDARNKA
ncbi:MAG: hypothetical protein HY731_08645, partial [Candidatus Tectomicrobia bacterium]|nr:hypothetical protein [Candidatus Tectomicrobia bacterium]